MFVPSVDAEQACPFATNAQHERFSCDIHTIILVGDTAQQGRYYKILPAPTRNLL